MINIQERNKNITNLIESVIKDHCRIYDTTFKVNEDGIIVLHNDEPLYLVGLEFSESEFYISFEGFVFSNLSMSKAIKLREIYREDSITEFLTTNDMEIWFYEDEYLMAKCITTKKYKDYSILKTAFAIDLFEQINNTVTIRNHLTDLLEEKESVLAN